MINDAANGRADITMFQKLLICPIYKVSKHGPVNNCTSWRPIALAETLFKLIESCYIHMNKHTFESNFGDYQNAYTSKKGGKNALKQLHKSTTRRGECFLVQVDVSQAFDSSPYDRMLVELFRRSPCSHFGKKTPTTFHRNLNIYK